MVVPLDEANASKPDLNNIACGSDGWEDDENENELDKYNSKPVRSKPYVSRGSQ